MSRTHIYYMGDTTLEALRSNMKWATQQLIENPTSSHWVEEIDPGHTYIEKRYYIDDFKLKIPEGPEDKKTDIENSILLYETLHQLPPYVLSDEHFWNWINFTKGYETAIQLMPVTEGSSIFKDHWLFTQSGRRAILFGVLSRCYYRVAMTVDPKAADKYELSRFVIENPNRVRNYTWRSISNYKEFLRGILKAERDIIKEYGQEADDTKYYLELAKMVSQLGSVKLLDAMTEEGIYNFIHEKFELLLFDNRLISE